MSNSKIEYEGKILDIDIDQVREAIVKAGGVVGANYTFRRYVFDVVPAKKGTWARLRTNGETTTLTVKEIKDDTIAGTSEWEVTVSSFEDTLTILEKSGLVVKSYQENRRFEFALEGAELSVDYWPKLKPYLEIEATSRDHVVEIAELLGFNESDLVGDNTMKLYERIGIDLDAIPYLKFD